MRTSSEYVCRVGISPIFAKQDEATFSVSIFSFIIHKYLLVFSVDGVASLLDTLTSGRYGALPFLALSLSISHDILEWVWCVNDERIHYTLTDYASGFLPSFGSIKKDLERWNENMVRIYVNLRISGLRRKYVRKYLWWKQFDNNNQNRFGRIPWEYKPWVRAGGIERERWRNSLARTMVRAIVPQNETES